MERCRLASMIFLPPIIANARNSRSSRPDIDASERISTGSNAPIVTGASEGVPSVVIAMGLIMSVIPNVSIADIKQYQEADVAEAVQLSTSKILETFSDTLDRGAVQSKSGISAETRWLSNGGFETRWWRETGEAPKINLAQAAGRQRTMSVACYFRVRASGNEPLYSNVPTEPSSR